MNNNKITNNLLIDNELLNHTKSDIITPDNISLIMSKYLKDNGTLLEPSVGTGNLLKYLNLNNYDSIDIFDIKKEYLDKIIIQDNIIKINKYNEDFIKYTPNKKYDNIILNPPYIRIQHLSEDYRKFIKNNYTFCNTGNFDIYYIFILKCLSLLSNNGIMVAIIPNSYLYNKSSTKLRKYLIQNKLINEIIDYKTEKIFKGISTYCCITIFTKNEKEHLIYNNDVIKYSNINHENNKQFNIFDYVNNNNSIPLILSMSKKLKDICIIKNGIATLRDKIFIHDHKLFNEDCWKEIINGKLINNNDIFKKYIIYPYDSSGKIIKEDKFNILFPLTYQYLLDNKNELLMRDKGNKEYPEWFAFGRTQGIIKPENKFNKNLLYIPIFIDPNNFYIIEHKSILHYASISINITNNDISTEFIKNIIYNSIDYITKSSSKRGSGWINLSSTILNEINIT